MSGFDSSMASSAFDGTTEQRSGDAPASITGSFAPTVGEDSVLIAKNVPSMKALLSEVTMEMNGETDDDVVKTNKRKLPGNMLDDSDSDGERDEEVPVAKRLAPGDDGKEECTTEALEVVHTSLSPAVKWKNLLYLVKHHFNNTGAGAVNIINGTKNANVDPKNVLNFVRTELLAAFTAIFHRHPTMTQQIGQLWKEKPSSNKLEVRSWSFYLKMFFDADKKQLGRYCKWSRYY